MSAFLILFGFLLAVIANVKITVLHKAVVEMYETLSQRINDVRDAKVVAVTDSAPSQVIKSTVVEPETTIESATLQKFYGLDAIGRDQFFRSVATSSLGSAFELLYKASYGDQVIQRAADLQSGLQSLSSYQYALVRQAILNAYKDFEDRTRTPEVKLEAVPVKGVVDPTVETQKPQDTPSPRSVAEPKKRRSKKAATEGLPLTVEASI